MSAATPLSDCGKHSPHLLLRDREVVVADDDEIVGDGGRRLTATAPHGRA